jgi:hypothetical protein
MYRPEVPCSIPFLVALAVRRSTSRLPEGRRIVRLELHIKEANQTMVSTQDGPLHQEPLTLYYIGVPVQDDFQVRAIRVSSLSRRDVAVGPLQECAWLAEVAPYGSSSLGSRVMLHALPVGFPAMEIP